MKRKLGLVAAVSVLMAGTAAFAADPPVPNSSPGPDGGKSPGVQIQNENTSGAMNEATGPESQNAQQDSAPDSGPGPQPKSSEGASKH
jgi:hypothetical protein